MAQPQHSSGPGNDRFGFTLFLSLAVHAVLILGLGFNYLDQQDVSPSLEITLARFQSEAPDDPDFLAQENQQGSGTLDEAATPSTTEEALFHDQQINDINLRQQSAQTRVEDVSTADIVTARAADPQTRPDESREEEEETADHGEENREQEEVSETLASLQAQLDNQRQAYANRPRRYTISSASTQRSRDAEYLDAWRKRIEAVGNSHYPEEASARGIYGNLRLMVALRPDGSIAEIRILRSSGHTLLDEAAIRIVHLAAPFEEFPDSMRSEVDILEIVRTWQFHQRDGFSSY